VVASICGLSQVYQLEVVYLIRMANSTERYVTFSDVSVVLFPSFFGVLMTTFKIDNYIDYYNQLRKVKSPHFRRSKHFQNYHFRLTLCSRRTHQNRKNTESSLSQPYSSPPSFSSLTSCCGSN
jgi:hypothetical protein